MIKNENNTKIVTVTPEYIKKTLEFDNSNVLQINVKCPVVKITPSVDYKKAMKKINNFYDAAIKNFINYCETRLYKNAAAQFLANKTDEGKSFKPFGAVITFEVAYNKQDFLCIYLDINIYAGKGRGNSVRKAQIWRIDNGELLAPDKFIKFTRPVKQKICGYICETMEKQMEKGEEYYTKSDMPSVYKYLNAKNFYLSERGYCFFFPQNTIALFDSGIMAFEIPDKIINKTDKS